MPNGNFDDIFPQVGGTLHDAEHAEPLADEKIENDTKKNEVSSCLCCEDLSTIACVRCCTQFRSSASLSRFIFIFSNSPKLDT